MAATSRSMRARVVDGAGDVVGPQRRQAGEQRPLVQALEALDLGRGLGEQAVEGRQLVGAADEQSAARRQHRMPGEAARPVAIEAAAGQGERADHPVAIGLGAERRGRAARCCGSRAGARARAARPGRRRRAHRRPKRRRSRHRSPGRRRSAWSALGLGQFSGLDRLSGLALGGGGALPPSRTGRPSSAEPRQLDRGNISS